MYYTLTNAHPTNVQDSIFGICLLAVLEHSVGPDEISWLLGDLHCFQNMINPDSE